MPDPMVTPSLPQPERRSSRYFRTFFTLQREAPWWQRFILGGACIGMCLGIWWFVTRGEAEMRILPPSVLPSPGETFGTFESLWFDRALTRNAYTTLRRVAMGFGLAAVVGIPLGVLAGCFGWLNAFLTPLTLFGRNIPIAALIPLTFSFFGIEEKQK